MSRLREIQNALQNYLRGCPSDIIQEVVNSQKVPAEMRLEIYRFAYAQRLAETLQEDFTALKRLLGEEKFHNMAMCYISVYPSKYRSLRWFGQSLSKFLAETDPYQKRPILSELAKLEWLFCYAFDAADMQPITINEVAKTPAEQWPTLRFKFHPSLKRVTTDWNSMEIWQACDQEKTLPKARRLKNSKQWIIWRADLEVQYRQLSQDEAMAIDRLLANKTFAEMCEHISHKNSDLIAAQWLHCWIAEGLII